MYAPWHPSKSHHLVLNHSNEYKDSITGAHTNTIEGLWMHAKRERNGNSYVTDALIEYMWRRFHATWTSGTTQMSVSMNSLMLCISRVFGDDFAGIQKQHHWPSHSPPCDNTHLPQQPLCCKECRIIKQVYRMLRMLRMLGRARFDVILTHGHTTLDTYR